jgi:hypothetical protein
MQVGERWFGVKTALCTLEIAVAEFGGKRDRWRMTVCRRQQAESENQQATFVVGKAGNKKEVECSWVLIRLPVLEQV